MTAKGIRPITTLLVANRGEIALRIARTARAVGMRTVAVASDADLGAPHTVAAEGGCDGVMPIGGERPADSYLQVDKILAAARQAKADAVHPGYGFLSENAAFAQAVLDAGLIWVGPPPAAMAAMGDKAAARITAARLGVPVVPGYDGEDQADTTFVAEAERIGYPVMIKASAGGGGRGMRLVADAAALPAMLGAARREAQAAFGNPRLILERAVQRPRHVEVQVFADAHGHLLHLGERDCSVQRRHQKLVEEAPSPAVSPALRRAMGEQALALCRAMGYQGAGTVEFLLAPSGEFFFMEMNTRLQVEHPVTEALLGVDLVAWQLRVAMGEALPKVAGLTQEQVLQRYETGGHAIEVRLCAEDPAKDFLPQSGTIHSWSSASGVRTDHALRSGLHVSPFYDSMLAKVIAHGPTRAQAVGQLASALEGTVLLGLLGNRGFLVQVLRHPVFADGTAVSTGFLAECFGDPSQRLPPMPGQAWQAVAHWVATRPPAAMPAAWRGLLPQRQRTVVIDSGDAVHHLQVGAEAASEPCDGLVVVQQPSPQGNWLHVQLGAANATWRDITLTGRPSAADVAAAQAQVRAPMHGRLIKLNAQPGDPVAKGQVLAVLEAMKMEHQLVAARDGTLKATHAAEGEQVAANALLLELA
jgi:geranyl-CoA carboxylase alpha subunit